MKKQILILGIASVLSVSLAQAALTELRTVVTNNTNGDIWATWESATFTGKIVTSVSHAFGLKKHRYLLIPAGQKYTMAHTGDKLHVYYYPGKGTYTKAHASIKGYKSMWIYGSKKGEISESTDADKDGVKTGGTSAGAVGELRTQIYNKTQGDTWVTWKSSTTAGKVFTTPFHWMREHRFVVIKPGHSYAMMHTGDKLSAYVYSKKDSDNAQEVEYLAAAKGYKNMRVDIQNGKPAVTESK